MSEHVFGDVEEVKAQLKAAKRLRPGGVKTGKEIFDHTPLTMVRRNKLAVNKSRQRETTRWRYAILKNAMDNPEAELQFEKSLVTVVDFVRAESSSDVT